MAISVNLKKTPICVIDNNLLSQDKDSVFYFSSYKGLSDWAQNRDVKIIESPAVKQENIVDKVLSLCEDERIYSGSDFKETEGVNKGPQIKKYFNEVLGIGDGQPWCCVFACWILMKSGVNFIKTADTWALRDYAKLKNILSNTPEEGDIFLEIGNDGNPVHTGFVKKVDPSDIRYLLTIEGNAGDSIKNCNDKLIKNCKFVHWQKLV